MYSPRSRYKKIIVYSGVIDILIAVSVLFGWQANIQPLKNWIAGVTPMNPVVAIVFVLSGLWALNFKKGNKTLLMGIGGVIALFGFVHFITYFFPCNDIRLDFLLFGNKIRESGIPNLIAPNTALNFLLCGVAMILAVQTSVRTNYVRQALMMFSFILVYTSLLGYLFHIQPAYRFGGLTPMALVTSTAFLFLCVGLFFSETITGLSQIFTSAYNGGLLMRRAFPFVLIVPPLIGYLRFRAEQVGLFTGEFGVEFSSFIFTVVLLIFITIYAYVINDAENLADQSSRRYKILMDSLHEAVLEFDTESKIVYANPGFERLFGFAAKDVIGQNAIDLMVPAKDRQNFEKRLKERNQGKSEFYTSEFVTKNGDRKFVSIHAQPLPDAKGNIKGTVVSFNDITEQKLHMQDLEAFTASAAHDLNSPLASIQMLMRSICKEGLTDDQMMMINLTEDTAGRMSQLLQDLLQFYRWGEKELKKTKVDAAWIVREVFDICDTTKTEMILHELPSVYANEAAVRQLFTNLISNAIKYSSRSEKPRVEVGSFTKHNDVWFYISDNGIGIDEAYIPLLFSPFKRFTSKFEGNGLGLAIVKRIIEKHGGSIKAKNNEGGGMRFEFTVATER